MKADTWMALYVGAYLADTMHLARQHHGSYLLLIMAAFKNGGWLPADDVALATIAKCTAKEWRSERGLYADFFYLTSERWTHKRVSEEAEKAARITEQRRQAGIESAAKRERERQQIANETAATVERPLGPLPLPSQGKPLEGLPPDQTPPPIAARDRAEGAHTHDAVPNIVAISTMKRVPQ